MLSGRLFRASARLGALMLVGGFGVSASSCSLLIDKNADQCEANSDCTKFAGTTCQENVCIAATCATLADCSTFPGTICKSQTCQPIGDDGCQKNQECIDKDGEYNVCRKDIGACVALQTKECATVLGDWQDDNAVSFGAIFPLDKQDVSTGEALLDSVKLALGDFQRVNNLPPVPGGTAQRPIVVVVCSDSGLANVGETSAKHLVNDLGVPAIIGPAFSGVTISVATDVTIPGGTLLFSPSATSTDITTLDDHGLVWRTSPSDVYQAATLMAYVPQYVEAEVRTQLMLMPSDKIKLAVLYKGDAYGTGLATALTPNSGSKLEINGAPVTDPSNEPYFKSLDFGNPDDPSADPIKYSQTVAAMLSFEPNIILVFGTDQGVDNIFTPIEKQWPTGIPKPEWVFSDGGEISELWDAIGTNDTLRQRVSGTAPGTNNQVFLNFKSAFNSQFTDASPDVFGTAGSYDIVYLLAFSTVALGKQPLTGANYNTALQNFFIKGPQVTVGGDINSAFQILSQGNSIDIDGASGELNFNVQTGEAPSDIQVWCVPSQAGKATDATNSGLYFSADKNVLKGTFDAGGICD